jgi:hypothetical protein
MNGVAAKIAKEIGILFENDDVDASAGEQESEHHSRGSAAGNAAAGCERFRHALTPESRSDE